MVIRCTGAERSPVPGWRPWSSIAARSDQVSANHRLNLRAIQPAGHAQLWLTAPGASAISLGGATPASGIPASFPWGSALPRRLRAGRVPVILAMSDDEAREAKQARSISWSPPETPCHARRAHQFHGDTWPRAHLPVAHRAPVRAARAAHDGAREPRAARHARSRCRSTRGTAIGRGISAADRATTIRTAIRADATPRPTSSRPATSSRCARGAAACWSRRADRGSGRPGPARRSRARRCHLRDHAGRRQHGAPA